MGITASVDIKWLIFFIISIILVIASLAAASKISKLFFKKPFFFASFTEGNTLSTLEINSKNSILSIENSKYIKSQTSDENGRTYFLASDNFEKLKEMVNELEKEEIVFNYQLNLG